MLFVVIGHSCSGGKHMVASGQEEESMQAISFCFLLDIQSALCLPELIMELQDIGTWGGLDPIGVRRATC